MTDIEIEKLEKLLNCKNKAVKKWIEEKEQHYDNLTQKLLKNGKKLARHMSLKSQNICENKVLDQLSESHPSSIRITESENEDESLKTNLSESQVIEHSLIEHMKREFGNDATSEMFNESLNKDQNKELSQTSEIKSNIQCEIEKCDIQLQPYSTETRIQKSLLHNKNSKVVDYSQK